MKKTTLLAVAAFAALSVSSAFAQGSMMSKKPMMSQGKMDPMMGLTAKEKKVAMMHMKKMTPAEKAVMMKSYKMRAMGKSEKEAMMGMSKSDKATMMSMMKKMTPMEKTVAMKMMNMAQKHAMMK